MEECNSRSDEYSKPASFSLRFLSGLVDVENGLLRKRSGYLFMSRRQGFGDFLMKLAHRSQTDVNP